MISGYVLGFLQRYANASRDAKWNIHNRRFVDGRRKVVEVEEGCEAHETWGGGFERKAAIKTRVPANDYVVLAWVICEKLSDNGFQMDRANTYNLYNWCTNINVVFIFIEQFAQSQCNTHNMQARRI